MSINVRSAARAAELRGEAAGRCHCGTGPSELTSDTVGRIT
jgi:hypothetical protein